MVKKNVKQWLDKTIPGYEVRKAAEEGKSVIFVPIQYEKVALKYFKRWSYKWEYRASYTWIAIFI